MGGTVDRYDILLAVLGILAGLVGVLALLSALLVLGALPAR